MLCIEVINKNILIVAHGNNMRALFVNLELKDEFNINTFEISTYQLIYIYNIEYNFINNYFLFGVNF